MGLLTAGIVLTVDLSAYGSRLSDLFYHPRKPSGNVVLIAIDDDAVQQYDWPIERFVHSGFLVALARAQPRIIVLDFSLPDPASPDEDVLFAQVLQRAGNVVQPVLGIESTRFSIPNAFPAFDAILKPTAASRTPNTTLAHAMIYPDADGVTRRVPLAIDGLDRRYPAMGIAVWLLYQGPDAKIEFQQNQFLFEGTPVALDAQGQALINFVDSHAIPRISYADVTRGRADLSILRDKIVLVGPTTKSVHENYNVPLTISNSPLYNVELQVDVLETFLSKNFLQRQDTQSRAITVIVLGLMAGVSLIYLPRFYAAALALLYLAAYMVFGFWQFDNGVILAPLDVILVLVLTLTATMFYRYFAKERTRAFIARLFLGTVAPEAVEQVLAQYDRGAFPLAGGRRDVTVLSITLRGLAPLSEATAPEAVMRVMNEYSARIFEVVFRHGGSIYSQVANTIIAMWNLPLSQPDHAQRGVRAAFEIREQILRLKENASERPDVESGLGIATGGVIAGRLTASPRAEYSVIGDVVNVAERLSILATQNRVYVDDTTRDQAGDEYESQRAQAIHLRGKKDPVQSWELQPRLTLKQISLS